MIMEASTKTEEQFISDIKKSIEDATLRMSDKVIKSAYSYLSKNECLNPSKESEARAFFLKRIPTVITNEVTKELYTVLGLNLDI